MKTVFLVKFQGVLKVSEESFDDLPSSETYERKVEATSERDVKVFLSRLYLFVNIISCTEVKDATP